MTEERILEELLMVLEVEAFLLGRKDVGSAVAFIGRQLKECRKGKVVNECVLLLFKFKGVGAEPRNENNCP